MTFGAVCAGILFGNRRSTTGTAARSPGFALDLDPEAVTLWERTPLGAWEKFAAARLDDPEFRTVIDLLRSDAEAHAGGRAPVRLWLPGEQVLKKRAWVGAVEPAALQLQAAFDYVARDTVYRPEDVAVAVGPADENGEATILIAFAETWREARAYAARWGFLPGEVSTRYHAEDFGPDGPVFRLCRERTVPGAPWHPGRRLLIGAALAIVAVAAALWASLPWQPPPEPVEIAAGPEPIAPSAAPGLALLGGFDAAPGPALGAPPAGPNWQAAPSGLSAPPRPLAAIAPPVYESAPATAVQAPPTIPDAPPQLAALAQRAAITPRATAAVEALSAPMSLADPPTIPPPPDGAATVVGPALRQPAPAAAAAAADSAPAALPAYPVPAPLPIPRPAPSSDDQTAAPSRFAATAAPLPIPRPVRQPVAARPAPVAPTAASPMVGPELDPDIGPPAPGIAASPAPKAKPARPRPAVAHAALVGILHLDSGRKALLRLPGGDFRSVTVGDVLDGWRVNGIGKDSMRMSRRGENRTLLLVVP